MGIVLINVYALSNNEFMEFYFVFDTLSESDILSVSEFDDEFTFVLIALSVLISNSVSESEESELYEMFILDCFKI
jgi:hypothetical protein